MSTEKCLFATVCIKPNCKNCFVELSESLTIHWRSSLGNSMPAVVGIQNAAKEIAYASWIPARSNKDLGDGQAIYIGKSFADCIGMKDNDVVGYVFLHAVLNTNPCQKVCVAPVNPDEWEILDLNSQLIEQSLLEQIRVIYLGLEFPIFLKGSAVVVLRIESIAPITETGYLEEFTELHIVPKSSNGEVATKRQKSKWTNKPSIDSASHLEERQGFLPWKTLNSLWTSIFGSNSGVKTDADEQCNTRTAARTSYAGSECNEIHVDEAVRLYHFSHSCNKYKESFLRSCSYKPFSLNVNEDFMTVLSSSSMCMKLYERRKLIVKACKILSPRDRVMRKKEQRNGGHNVSLRSINEKAAIMELSFDDAFGAAIFDKKRWASVNSELMAYLDVSESSLLGITCVHTEPMTLCGVNIHVIDAKGKSVLDASTVCSKFQEWIEQRLGCKNDEMIVNDSMAINMEDFEGSIWAVVDFQSKDSDNEREKYFFINKSSLENVSIVVKFPDKDENNLKYSYLQKYFQRHEATKNTIGGFDELLKQGKDYLDGLFRYVISSNGLRCQHKGCLLICGSSRTTANGCGRTTLSKALCSIFQDSPYFCHIEIVDCIPLRGKKPETILHRFTVAMEEARWRQPSIVVFDDIDALIKQPDPVKDAEPTVIYHSKLAEGLKDLLSKELSSSSKLATVFISKTRDSLHDIFSVPTGWHFIAESLVVRPPNEKAREDMARVILAGLSCRIHEDYELRMLAGLTEGYLPADLNIILKRAKNSAIRDQFAEGSTTGLPAVSEKSIREALLGYKPLGLHGIDLHKPGNLGWESVGGLAEAKRVLQETFVWPMKYSSLFSKCPFRMRSGVLLYGPSGTGKTLLAGVVAKECGMNFVSIKGPELLSKYVGSSEQNVRDLFARAQSASPCILFFDEFDALAPKRGHDNTGVTDRVVNQLLTQLDGVEKLENVFILASTSRPDLIDAALLRPGRLDKCVYCPMPDENDRIEILKCLIKDLETDGEIDWLKVGQRTIDFSGADLKALLYNAQLNMIHKRLPLITDEPTENIEKINMFLEGFSMKISESDIMEALEDTKPSVSLADMEEYKIRFDSFVESRKGKSMPVEAGLRVTLA